MENKQYINVIKTQQNIKINYQILQNNQILKSEQSIFLLEDNSLSLDTNYKLQILQNSTPKTYISAICEDEQQTIVSNTEATSTEKTSIYFDHNHQITLPNSNIENIKQFYNNSDIDYLISPFTILYNILHDDLQASSLNLLILNNNIYSIILDENKRFCISCIKQLTPFEDIKKSNFYTDEIVEQKLYDEIYSLELNENISSITQSFYENNKDASFIQNINIYYNIKQLNETQLNTLTENLMIKVTYNLINLDEILYTIVKKQSIKKQSFIEPRAKKSSLSLGWWIVIVLLTTLVAGGIFYMLQTPEKKSITKTIQKKIKKVKSEKIEEISLPNHTNINTNLVDNLLDIFETISDDSVLKEIQLQKNESTLIYNFTIPNSYETILKPELLKIYEKSENILTSKNNSVYTAIISNTIPKNKMVKKATKKYKTNKQNIFLDKQNAIKILKSFFNTKTTIKNLSTSSTKYTTYRYKLTTIVATPKDFFNIIDKINKTNYSITLAYPIEFAKIKSGLEVNFKLRLNQNKQ